jgi:CBS domain-containing protein
MASNPELCLPLGEWRAKFLRLISEPDPEALLKASIYFDFRVLHGDLAMGEDLWRWLLERIAYNRGFLNHLAGTLTKNRLPVASPLWRLRVALGWNPGGLDLKRAALLPLVHCLRVMALGRGISAPGSLARLEALRRAGALDPGMAGALAEAWEFLTLLRLRHQFSQAARGEPPDNVVPLTGLNPLHRRFAVEALKTVNAFQGLVVSAHGGFVPE